MVEIKVVIFREDDIWVGQCVEHDIGAQAPNLEELYVRLDTVIAAECDESMRGGNEPFTGIPTAPARFKEMWDRKSGTITPSTPLAIDRQGVSIELGMAA